MPSPEWTDAQLEVLARTPRKWPRRAKLTSEQVKDMRRRIDSLTVPFTVNELAGLWGVKPWAVAAIARRLRWRGREHEPVEFWKLRDG